jgi:hypothetical protein
VTTVEVIETGYELVWEAIRCHDAAWCEPTGKDQLMTGPSVQQLSSEGLPVVCLTGEVDLAVAPGLQESLDLLLASGASTIVVDLLDATFLDSIALGVLVATL